VISSEPGAEKMGTTFGLIIPQRGSMFGLGSLRELLELGVRAEDSGLFDAVWVGDSLTSKPRPESIACLSALAGMTDRVRLGIGCMASFPVRDPALFAYQWATLDQISNGRALLSVCNGLQGGGASAREGAHFGGVADRERASRLEENVALVRRLWTGDVIDHHGRFSSYHQIQILPTPVQDPCPIWITANPRPGKSWVPVLRRVAAIGDGFQTSVMTPGSLGAMWDEIKDHLVDLRRDPTDFPVAAYHSVNIGPDQDACLDEVIRFFAQYYGRGFISPAVAACMAATGTIEQCRAHLLDVIRQGATHVMLRIASFDQDQHWTPLVAELLPSVLAEVGQPPKPAATGPIGHTGGRAR
jgi:alkanesulfonate monooxygenase SsuD/methylene tetrahydromethanopterin reductase-like flavin-dependent oxidoreductase (luciferase family)